MGTTMKMLKNNFFILYHVFKAVPMYMIGVLSCSVLQALLVAADLWVTKCIVNALLGEQFSLLGLLLFYGIYIIMEYLVLQIKIILTNYFQSMKGIEISVYMRRLLYNKVKELDLYCYENHEFYNDYERAVNEIDTRPVQVIDSLADFLSCVLSMFFITLVVFEPVFLLAAVGVVIEYLIYLKKLNRINYQMDRETSLER